VEVYLARQPILNKNLEIVAYELLYRSNKTNNFAVLDNDQATIDVLNSSIQIGIDDLSEGKPCFVNFTDTLLKNELPNYFPSNMLTVEILETVTLTDEIINICRNLKVQGYKIALDDFELIDNGFNYQTIMSLVDIIKIDIQKTPRERQLYIKNLLNQYDVDFLAEKVETIKEYQQCLIDGYNYFQGYFLVSL
jgi:EAL and modified HD-GYP domain-containing signal transduction protein